jgi:hypothetical protein
VPRPLPPTTAPRAVGLGAIELLLFGRHVSEAGKEDAAERNHHFCCCRKRSKATERIRGPAGAIPHNGEHSDQGLPIGMRCREPYVST